MASNALDRVRHLLARLVASQGHPFERCLTNLYLSLQKFLQTSSLSSQGSILDTFDFLTVGLLETVEAVEVFTLQRIPVGLEDEDHIIDCLFEDDDSAQDVEATKEEDQSWGFGKRMVDQMKSLSRMVMFYALLVGKIEIAIRLGMGDKVSREAMQTNRRRLFEIMDRLQEDGEFSLINTDPRKRTKSTLDEGGNSESETERGFRNQVDALTLNNKSVSWRIVHAMYWMESVRLDSQRRALVA